MVVRNRFSIDHDWDIVLILAQHYRYSIGNMLLFHSIVKCTCMHGSSASGGCNSRPLLDTHSAIGDSSLIFLAMPLQIDVSWCNTVYVPARCLFDKALYDSKNLMKSPMNNLLVVTLIHYPFTMPLPGLTDWSAFLEWILLTM